jgi:hypothetical protein
VSLHITEVFNWRVVFHGNVQVPKAGFGKIVDFSCQMCNNIGIVAGNDTDNLSFFDQELACGKKSGR